MTTSILENKQEHPNEQLYQQSQGLPLDSTFFNEQIHRIIDSVLPKVNNLLRKHLLFHAIFFILAISEIVFLFLFTTFLVQSSLLAFTLATIFLTCFSYYTLRIYFQSKKPQQIEEIVDLYIRGCKHLIAFREELPEHHLALADACTKFAVTLQGRESQFYRIPAWLDFIRPMTEHFSAWCHWYDVYVMRELLLQKSIEQHIKLVKLEPTDLEVHAALANAYVLLSSLYKNIHPESDDEDEERWAPPQKFQDAMQTKFRVTAEKAIEEFKILNDYAPDDPWVHAQLAYSYHDLGMPEEEILEYETILGLCPDDKDTLYKLGVLYFQEGHNAKGLQIYEELRLTHFKRAERLIQHYT